MTRQRLMEIALEHGLTLDVERVTTGTRNGAAFRTFEFTSSSRESLVKAANDIRDGWTHTPGFVTVRVSDADWKPYLEVSSFYCGPN